MKFEKDDEDLQREFEDLKTNYDFNFENLSFGGGGCKTAAYVGAIEVLEGLGVMQKSKCFSGTSGGAIIAACLAVQLNSKQIKELTDLPFQDLVNDSWFSKWNLPGILYNLWNKYGWNPAQNLYEQMRSVMKDQTGKADITFQEVYDKYGTNLCIVATNVTSMSVEYFHVKTTPNMSVAQAVHASAAIPGYIQPVRVEHQDDMEQTQFYSDGGLVCNYPLQCFDGWYLSMKPEDNYMWKLGKEEPFSEFNGKSLGFMLYAAGESDFMHGEGSLRSRLDHPEFTVKRPNTELAKERTEMCESILKTNQKSEDMMQAAKHLMENLRATHSTRDNDDISLSEFKTAVEQLEPEEVTSLFGEDFHAEDAFDEMDNTEDEKITFDELKLYMHKKGFRFREILEGGTMVQINSMCEFFPTVLNTVLNMTRRVYYKEDDMYRSAAIYTDYIGTFDFNITLKDKEFAIRQGVIGALAYFKDVATRKEKGMYLPECIAENIVKKSVASEDAQRDPSDEAALSAQYRI